MLKIHTRGMRGGVIAALAVALISISFALAPRPAEAASQSVSITGFAFPATTTINVGEMVTWTNNHTGVPHTVTADGGAFGSGTLSTGQSFSHTFSAAGTFAYHCTIHPAMTGSVVVAAQTTATATATTATATATTATATATGTTATATSTPTQISTSTPTATTAAPTATTTGTAAPATAAPRPPATGNGTAGGTSSAFLLLLAGLGSIALTGGTLIAIRKRS